MGTSKATMLGTSMTKGTRMREQFVMMVVGALLLTTSVGTLPASASGIQRSNDLMDLGAKPGIASGSHASSSDESHRRGSGQHARRRLRGERQCGTASGLVVVS